MKQRKLTVTQKLFESIGLLLMFLPVSIAQPAWALPEMISPQDLAAQLNSPTAPLILDVRSNDEFMAGHIPGAVNIPYREIPGQLEELAAFRTEPIVVYCEIGVRAEIAELMLEQAGFEDVVQLEGNIQGWREEELPVEIGQSEPTS